MGIDEAREIAEGVLGREVAPMVEDLVALDSRRVVETDSEFVFFYNTVAFLETRSMTHALAGNGPIAVDRTSGAVRFLDSSGSWEEQI